METDFVQIFRKIGLPLLVLLLVLSGCHTAKVLPEKPGRKTETECVAAKVEYKVPFKGKNHRVNGQLRMRSGERILFSVQMPVLLSEVGRVEITPDEVLLVDRMGKRYLRASARDLRDVVRLERLFKKMDEFIRKAAHGGPASIKAGDLGIRQIPEAGFRLHHFSLESFELPATRLSPKYKEVTIEEVAALLKELL